MKEFLERLRVWWVKSKFYVIGAAAVAILVLLLLMNVSDGSTDPLTGWLFNKQKSIVKSELERSKAKEAKTQEEIDAIDERISQIDQNTEKQKKKVSTMDLKELADAWKELGL